MKVKTYFEADSEFHRLHTYSKGSPFHNSGKYILYVRFRNLGEPGQMCLLDRADETERVIGETDFVDYHHGVSQYFCDSGSKVIYQSSRDTVALYDLESGKTDSVKIQGKLCNYSGYLDRHFIERDDECDESFQADSQMRMGLYINTIDGKSSRKVADIEKLLSIHPCGGDIRRSRILLRLGGDIRPDQKKLLVYLVGRDNTLVRDYFLCDFEGNDFEFLGRIGTHVMWCPDSRHIVACVTPWKTDLGGLGEYPLSEERDASGLLAIYDTEKKKHEIASIHPISGGSHQSPSPDGGKVVIDSCNRPSQSIYLFDTATARMSEIFNFDKVPLRDDPYVAREEMRNHAHPAFSPDSKHILLNKCTDGVTRLCEITL